MKYFVERHPHRRGRHRRSAHPVIAVLTRAALVAFDAVLELVPSPTSAHAL